MGPQLKAGPLLKGSGESNSNPKANVVVVPQVGKDGKDYKDYANKQPASIPFDAGLPEGKTLMYAYKNTACNDNHQAANEVGIDCGIAACGVKCDWGSGTGKVKKGGSCDQSADCASKALRCDDDGKCADSYFSCYDVKRFSESAPKDGYYLLAVDEDATDMDNVKSSGKTVEVLCEFYDGNAYVMTWR